MHADICLRTHMGPKRTPVRRDQRIDLPPSSASGRLSKSTVSIYNKQDYGTSMPGSADLYLVPHATKEPVTRTIGLVQFTT